VFFYTFFKVLLLTAKDIVTCRHTGNHDDEAKKPVMDNYHHHHSHRKTKQRKS
jgi:hypothetical protein